MLPKTGLSPVGTSSPLGVKLETICNYLEKYNGLLYGSRLCMDHEG
jgi:hypothetical protein